MSTTTLEIDAPHVRADQLVARPGGLPTVTVPMTTPSPADADAIWRHLAEPADFFGVPMPSRHDLAAALSVFADTFRASPSPALVAATVTIADLDGAPQILLSGSTVRPGSDVAVRIGRETMPAGPDATDPWWRRMAARTTSGGELDQCARWLAARGLADALCDGRPALGAVVLELDGRLLGVENPEPTSVLDQLTDSGLIAAVDRGVRCPPGANRAWWVSPRFTTHPVAELDGTALAVAAPPFARWT